MSPIISVVYLPYRLSQFKSLLVDRLTYKLVLAPKNLTQKNLTVAEVIEKLLNHDTMGGTDLLLVIGKWSSCVRES